MRKAIIAVALLSLLAGSVQAKSYNMIGWWRENRTASPPILFAGAAVDGDTTKSNLFINAFPTTVGAASDPDWTHETTYGVIAGGVDIITDTETITFFSNGPGMNLSNPLGGNAPDYHPGEFLFTMDIVQSGGGSLTGTVTATWSNDEDSLQTYDPETYDPEALVYGVGPGVDITQPGNWPAGNHGLNVVVDIPGIPEDAIIPEPVTMLAAGAGLMGLGGYIRRRRRG